MRKQCARGGLENRNTIFSQFRRLASKVSVSRVGFQMAAFSVSSHRYAVVGVPGSITSGKAPSHTGLGDPP